MSWLSQTLNLVMGGRPERRLQDGRAFAQVEELEPRLCLGALEPPQIPDWDCGHVPAEIAGADGYTAETAATLQELLQPIEIQADPTSYPVTADDADQGVSAASAGSGDAELALENGEETPETEAGGLGNQIVAALLPMMFVGAMEDSGTPPADGGSGSGGSGGSGGSAGGSLSDPVGLPSESLPPTSDGSTSGPVTPPIDQGGGSSISSGQVPFSDSQTTSVTSLNSQAMSEVPSGNQPGLGGYTYISDAPPANGELSAAEVTTLLERASEATVSQDGIFAIVDRNGRILGVRVEAQVPITDIPTLVFAIDGAVAKARTAAFFASAGDPNDTSDGGVGGPTPLTSRTIRSLSESTITQREVEANPNSTDPSIRGPGAVAPIGIGGHFPPGVMHTPQVDLFNIEYSNRDSTILAGPNGIRENGAGDDITLATRFNAPYDPGKALFAPESYGLVSGLMPTAQSRGIATLPGGIPIIRNNADVGAGTGFTVAGGLGVFFPGTNGYATFEQNFQAGAGQTSLQRVNAPKVLEAEYIAFAALGGVNQSISIPGAPALPTGVFLPAGRIDLVGLQLEVFGPGGFTNGPKTLGNYGASLGVGINSGTDRQVTTNPAVTALDGLPVPSGWLVSPRNSVVDNITAADVQRIIQQGVNEANLTRSAIRLPLGRRTKMVLSVTDTAGNVLGLFRMDDSTVFSIDIAVTKARNAAYYADPTSLQAVDQVPGIAAGVAFSARTFRFLAEPRFPSGVDFTQPAPFSILNDPGIDPVTGENTGAPTQFAQFQSVLGYDKFNPGHNFRDPNNLENQSGVVLFPGSSPVYKAGVLVGGYGTSGDGVDQDDVITAAAMQGYSPQEFGVTRADEVFFRDTRLPFMKFNRNPRR